MVHPDRMWLSSASYLNISQGQNQALNRAMAPSGDLGRETLPIPSPSLYHIISLTNDTTASHSYMLMTNVIWMISFYLLSKTFCFEVSSCYTETTTKVPDNLCLLRSIISITSVKSLLLLKVRYSQSQRRGHQYIILLTEKKCIIFFHLIFFTESHCQTSGSLSNFHGLCLSVCF